MIKTNTARFPIDDPLEAGDELSIIIRDVLLLRVPRSVSARNPFVDSE